MYTIVDLYSDCILYNGNLIDCFKFKPKYNSLLDFAICYNDRIVKIINGLM